MATPRPYKDGWRVQFMKDGVRVSKVFALKREAAKWALEQESKKSLQSTKTLGQAVKRYLETVSIHKVDAVDWEKRRFDYLLEHFGDVALSSIDSEAIGEWRDERLKTVTGSTVMREIGLFRNLIRLALREWKWISENPFDGVRLPKSNEPRRSVWGWKDIWHILRAGKKSGGKIEEVTRAFHISLRTALRLQEC